SAFVLDGELRADDSGHSIYRGWRVKASAGDQGSVYEEARIEPADEGTPLEQWSQQRSQTIESVDSRSDTNSASNTLTAPSPGSLLYPVAPGFVSPRTFGFGLLPSLTPFSFFQWYNGGYSFYQPLISRPPLGLYPGFYFGRPPFYTGHPRPIIR